MMNSAPCTYYYKYEHYYDDYGDQNANESRHNDAQCVVDTDVIVCEQENALRPVTAVRRVAAWKEYMTAILPMVFLADICNRQDTGITLTCGNPFTTVLIYF